MHAITRLPRETSYAVQIHENQGPSQVSGRFVEIFADNGVCSRFNRESGASGTDTKPDCGKIMKSAQLCAICHMRLLYTRKGSA